MNTRVKGRKFEKREEAVWKEFGWKTELVRPEARFIGMSSFDREAYQLPSSVTMKLEDGDISRAKQMMSYPWFQRKEWHKELQHMLKSGVKLELEAFSNKDISFITEKYLPKKLKDKDWLV